MPDLSSAAALWWAVVLSGLYHGLNPGMGWPLAVSAALMERSPRSLWRALGALSVGHAIAMLAILLPFSALLILAEYQRPLQIGAALIVIALGLYLLWTRRHPRFLARVPPHRLALWSFLVALAHGAGLMLVPIYLGICQTVGIDPGDTAASELLGATGRIALLVAFAHTASMMFAGGAIAAGIYYWLGLKFLSSTFINLEAVWALSLVLVGVMSLVLLH